MRFPAPSGPPIAPLPRNRLAFSAAGGASPLSSSPQNPLRWASVGAPIGCAEKRKRFLMVSREKTLAAAFQAPPEMPFPAFYGGCLGADLSDCVYSTAYGRFRSWGCSRMLSVSLLLPHIGSCGKIGGKGGSGCPCFSFAAAAVSRERCQAPSNCQGAAVKRERRCVRKGPGLSSVSRADTGGKALDDHRAQTP